MKITVFFSGQISSYATRVFLWDAKQKASEQYYINFPSALAQAMKLSKGENVEWVVADKGNLILTRSHVPPNPVDIQKNKPRS